MVKVQLKRYEGRTVQAGGLWIYDNEIDTADGAYENGEIVEVLSYKGDFIGRGYINDHSKIRIRLLSRDPLENIGRAFFKKRIRDAWNYRKDVVDTGCCRVVFSDSDRLPGLIIDKFEDILVFEVDTLGMDVRKTMLAEVTEEIFAEDGIPLRGIYERSDAKVRTLEGLERIRGFLRGEFPTTVSIEENGVKLQVNVAEGQKTGYFLDQKYNHLAIRRLCTGKTVLDCCTHTGGFALSAAVTAKEVTGIDASELAIEQARINSGLNGFENTSFLVADVFEFLAEKEREGQKYDVIVLDPPAFTKSKSSLKNAARGYKEINYRAMKILNPGGFLVTCSCSEYMERSHFLNIVLNAANDAHKRLRLVENRAQSPDHPVILGANVSDYLKCVIFQVNDR